MRLEFAHPWLLALIPVVIAGLIVSARIWSRGEKSRTIKQIILRSIIFTLLIFALSGLSVLLKDDRVATVFVVDGSDSLKNRQSEITSFINDAIKEKKSSDYIAVVSFGKKAAIENFLSNETIYSGINSNIDASATNIEEAVHLALSLIPEGYAGRIVLISDGDENIGTLTDTAGDLALSGAELLTLSLEREETPEVYVSDLKVPDSIGTGERFTISVDVESNVATPAIVSLYLGRTLKGQIRETLQKGTNSFVFADTQEETGLKTYYVTVEAANDTYSINNEYSAYTNISQKLPVLLVEGIPGETSRLKEVLGSIGTETVTVSAFNAPDDLDSMLYYSAIVLANTYAEDLPEGFMENIEAYVKDHGRGFIACGGRQSFALGGYKGTVLEKILPVTMDVKGEKEIPSMAIMLVIDKSGSMSGTSLDSAKKAAIATVQTLRSTDSIGVVSFDDSFTDVVKLKTLANPEAVTKAINSIVIEGGTSIYPAVKHAYTELSKYDAKLKHIILLTDGEDGFEKERYADVIGKINDEFITFSTVGIGDGCNTDLLSYLANRCGGRFYQTRDGKDTPKIFMQEVYLAANSYIVDGEFTPAVTSNSEVITSVAKNGLPTLNAYIATTIKDRATMLLSSPSDDPVLSTIRYGLGNTVAWASDITAEWSGNFFGAPEINQRLWSNLISLVTQDVRVDGSYAEVTQTTDGATVTYHTADFSAKTAVNAIITDSDGISFNKELSAVSPGVYEGSFDMTGTGVYSIAINQAEDGEIVGGLTTAALKHYSFEYTFNDKPGLLSDYTAMVGGKEIKLPSEVFSSPVSTVKAMTELGTVLLLIAALLFVFDIAYRRFNFKLPKLPKKVKAAAPAKDPAVQSPTTGPTGPVTQTTAASVQEEASKKEKPAKKPKPPKEDKNKQPDLLDTSQLLNRLKK